MKTALSLVWLFLTWLNLVLADRQRERASEDRFEGFQPARRSDQLSGHAIPVQRHSVVHDSAEAILRVRQHAYLSTARFAKDPEKHEENRKRDLRNVRRSLSVKRRSMQGMPMENPLPILSTVARGSAPSSSFILQQSQAQSSRSLLTAVPFPLSSVAAATNIPSIPVEKPPSLNSSESGSANVQVPDNPAQHFIHENGMIQSAIPDTANEVGIGVWMAMNDAPQIDADYGHFITVNIGSQQTPFQIQIDTASGDSWVPCEDCTSCGQHQRLGKSSSMTYQPNESAKWSTSYSSSDLWSLAGSVAQVEGIMVQDTVRIGGITADNFRFGVATLMPDQFAADWIPFAGILGLGNSKVNPLLSMQRLDPMILTLFNADKVQIPQLGLALGVDGSLAIGGVNPALFEGTLEVVESVSNQGYWELPMSKVEASNTSFEFRTGIIDSRTALIFAPLNDTIGLFSDVKNAYFDLQTGLLLPCDTDATISFLIGAGTYSLKGADLLFAPVDGAEASLCGSGSSCCLSSLQAAPADLSLGDHQWILGSPFLSQVYIGLDFKFNRIGIAERKDSSYT